MSDIISCIISKTGLNNDDAKAIQDLVEKYHSQGLDVWEAIAKANNDVSEFAAVKKYQKIINADKREAFKAGIDNMIAQGAESKDSILNALAGTNRYFEGGRASLEARQKAQASQDIHRLAYDLKDANLESYMRDKNNEYDLAEALFRQTGGAGNGKKISQMGVKAAELIDKTHEYQRGMLNRAGALVKKRMGYITSHIHAREKIKGAGFDAWAKRIYGMLDWDRMGVSEEGRMPLLRGAYDKIVSGHTSVGDEVTVNIAGMASKRASFAFKTSKDFVDYNNEFGRGSLVDAVIGNVSNRSTQIALMDSLGSNPKNMLRSLIDEYQLDKADARKAVKYYELISGEAASPVDSAIANIGQTIRAMTIMATMGKAIKSYTLDIPVSVMKLNSMMGKDFLGSFVAMYSAPFKSLKSEDAKMVMKAFSIGIEGTYAQIVRHGYSDGDFHGKIRDATGTYFKYNLNNWWLNKVRVGATQAMASLYGEMSGRAFKDLPESTQRLMERYNIDSDKWDNIRKGVETTDKYTYITPDMIPDKEAAQLYRSMILDYLDDIVLTPGVRERYITAGWGSEAGTPHGELMRLFFQFKSFSITQARRVWGEAIYGKGNADITALGAYGLMLFGTMYARDALWDTIVEGKTPPDPENPDYLIGLAAYSGFGGIIGDMIMPLVTGGDKSWGKFASQLAGPFAGSIGSAADPLLKMAHGNTSNYQKSKAINESIDLLPYNNLFYVEPVLNYILLNQMNEYISPGYANRVEGYVKKYRGQEFYDKVRSPSSSLSKDIQ